VVVLPAADSIAEPAVDVRDALIINLGNTEWPAAVYKPTDQPSSTGWNVVTRSPPFGGLRDQPDEVADTQFSPRLTHHSPLAAYP
jgi:hypothetical protein